MVVQVLIECGSCCRTSRVEGWEIAAEHRKLKDGKFSAATNAARPELAAVPACTVNIEGLRGLRGHYSHLWYFAALSLEEVLAHCSRICHTSLALHSPLLSLPFLPSPFPCSSSAVKAPHSISPPPASLTTPCLPRRASPLCPLSSTPLQLQHTYLPDAAPWEDPGLWPPTPFPDLFHLTQHFVLRRSACNHRMERSLERTYSMVSVFDEQRIFRIISPQLFDEFEGTCQVAFREPVIVGAL